MKISRIAKACDYLNGNLLSSAFVKAETLSELESKISEIRELYFPASSEISETAPSWDEVGGLKDAKSVVEEIFGVTQRY